MAKKRKNANYVTEKTIAAKKAKEAYERKKKIKKILIPILITFGAILSIIALIFAIGVPRGMIDYKPEATETVEMTVVGYEDKITIEIYGNDAPKTAKRFIECMEKSTFNNSSFLYVKDGLLYFGSSTADAGTNGITGEFSENNVENNIVFRKGVIAMSRGTSPNSGSAQFFITTENATELNGKYAAFAKITSGFDVIEEIIDNAEYDSKGNITNATIKSVSYTTETDEHAGHNHS